MKFIKRFLQALLLIFVVLVAAIIIIVSVIDPNDYRQEIEQLAKEQGKVHIALDGDISWSLFPNIGFSIENAKVYQSLDSNQEIASVGETVLSLALIPLLSANVEIKGIVIDKLEANLEIDAKGQANWQKLIPEQEKEQQASKELTGKQAKSQEQSKAQTKGQESKQSPLKSISVEFLSITNTTINYKDKQTNQSWLLGIQSLELDNFSFDSPFPLNTDIELKGNNPEIQLSLGLSSQVRINEQLNRIKLSSMEADIEAQTSLLPGGSQRISLQNSAEIDLEKGTLSLPLKMQADLVVEQLSPNRQKISLETTVSGNYNKLQFQAKQLNLNADIDYPKLISDRQIISLSASLLDIAILQESIKLESANLKLDDLEAQITAAIKGFVSFSSDANISIKSFNPRQLLAKIKLDEKATAASLIPKMAGEQSLSSFALDAEGSFDQNIAKIDTLKLRLDESTLQGNAKYDVAANKVTADLNLDKINIDNYLPPVVENEKGSASDATKNKAQKAENKEDKKLTPEDIYSKDPVIPLNMLNLVYADAKIAAESIIIKKENIKKANVRLNNTKEKAQASIKAQALTGSINLNAALQKNTKKTSIALNSNLKNVDLEQALAMLQDEKLIGGKGNVSTRLSLRGNSIYDWVNSVSGPLSVSLNQGRLYGFNLTKKLCSAVVKLDGRTPRADGWDEFTKITRLDLSAKFNKGDTQINSLKLGLIDAKGQAKGTVNLPSLDFRIPIEMQITGDTEDAKCKANPTLESISWPLLCKGNALSTDPVDFCRPDLKLIQSRVAGQLKAKIDAEKRKLKEKLNAEKAKLKEKADAEKEKLRKELDDKKRQAQAKLDAEKAALEKKKKDEEAKLKAKLEQKKKDEENKLKDKLKNKLKGLF